ncbi:DUF1348 family protein [Pedobacter ginsengiterrae]|uniref:DUF1348 family protein n=1 Tax=Pedobacter ginsengiterrae TaxID=871696 RepID=UPI0031DFE2BE
MNLTTSLTKELWAFTDNRIAVRFEHEWHDHQGQWFRSFGMSFGNLIMRANGETARKHQ